MYKFCGDCDQNKPLTEFNKNACKVDGLQTVCRPCTKIRNNESYKTSDKRRTTIKNRNRSVAAYNQRFISRYKRLCGCRLCGEKEPVVLDLHHVNMHEKEADVSMLVRCGLKVIKAEIRKCVVLCSNCHRRVHAGLLNL